VLDPSTREASAIRRLIAAILLAFFVILPLHYHSVTATAQVSKECSCFTGGRTQLGIAPAVADFIPSLEVFSVALFAQQLFARLSFGFYPIRAPPAVFFS
jgi:hypothetical protein